MRGVVERDECEEVARVVHRRGANAQCYFDILDWNHAGCTHIDEEVGNGSVCRNSSVGRE